MDLIKELTKSQIKEMPDVQVGDTVKVHVKVKEGARERIQVYEGTVIAKKHGGIEETITVRRVSYGVGVGKAGESLPGFFAFLGFAAPRRREILSEMASHLIPTSNSAVRHLLSQHFCD